LLTSTEGDIDFIEVRYLESASNFHETITFLNIIGIIEIKNNKLYVKDSFLHQFIDKKLPDKQFDKIILKALLNKPTIYQNDVNNYLQKFVLVNGIFEYKPNTKERLEESDIRNLLLELDLLIFDSEKKKYLINYNHSFDFLKYLEQTQLAPKTLDYIKKQQLIIGELAEREVVNFEKSRLKDKPHLASEIEHIALLDASAGYDIKSFEISSSANNPIKRYIEVKAVSSVDYKFYWSRKEIEIAEKLKNQYFLYLLPVINTTSFDFNKIMIIENPYRYFFCNPNNWNKQEELFSFWR
jgi:hypothetical protein